MPFFQTLIKKVHPLFGDHPLQSLRVGTEDLYPYVIMQVGPVQQAVGLREEPSGIQGENPRMGIDLQHHVRNGLVLYAQAGGQGNAATELSHEKTQQLLRRTGRKLLIQTFNFRCCIFFLHNCIFSHYNITSIQIIMPAPTVSKLSGSIMIREPVVRFST